MEEITITMDATPLPQEDTPVPQRMQRPMPEKTRRQLAYMRALYQRLSRFLLGLAVATIWLAVGIPVLLWADIGGFLLWSALYALVLIIGFWFWLGRYLKTH